MPKQSQICPVCKRENHAQQIRCWVCGTPLSAKGSATPSSAQVDYPIPVAEFAHPKSENRSVLPTVLKTLLISLGAVAGGLIIGLLIVAAFVFALVIALVEACFGGGFGH